MVLGVVGFGRFSKFFSQTLKCFGDVWIFSRRDVSQEAKKIGCAQRRWEDLAKCDIIVVASAISDIAEVLPKIFRFAKKGGVVMDVASVKIIPCRLLKKYAPKDVHILGTHPMFGPDSASKGLSGLSMVFCPVRISRAKYNKILAMFRGLKLRIIETSPREHDRQSARSLALVHFIGRGLEKMGVQRGEVTTRGYEYLLELQNNVANDSERLFFDMHAYNPYAKKEREKFLLALQRLDKKLRSEY